MATATATKQAGKDAPATGRVVQITGPVLDIEFAHSASPLANKAGRSP